MPDFIVTCYEYKCGEDGELKLHNSSPLEVEAKDEREAAEKVCGGPLEEAGKPGELCAKVQSPDMPNEREFFRRKTEKVK